MRFKVRLDGVLERLFGFIVGVCLCDCCLTKYGGLYMLCYDYYVVTNNEVNAVGTFRFSDTKPFSATNWISRSIFSGTFIK